MTRAQPSAIPAVITRYFAAQSGRDFDAVVTLFAEDAVLIDEGQPRYGPTQFATSATMWPAYEYTTELLDVQRTGRDEYVARVPLEDNCPGRRADCYRFTIDGQQIRWARDCAVKLCGNMVLLARIPAQASTCMAELR